MMATYTAEGSGTVLDVPESPSARVVVQDGAPVQYVVRATPPQRGRPRSRDFEGDPVWWNRLPKT
jgi:hypothetical protein